MGYLAELGVTDITAEDLDAALLDIDLEELAYDRTEVVDFLTELGVDTTTMDPATFDEVLVKLGV